METRQLECFVAVAEELHFGRAAARLFITQPSLSQQIRRLERNVGYELFFRTSRRVEITAEGLRLLPEAQEILRRVELLPATVAPTAVGLPPTLHLGISEGLGERLDHFLDALTDRTGTPVSVLSARLDDRLDRVRDGRLDATFVRGIETAPGLVVQPMWNEPLVAALPSAHPLAGRSEIPLVELAALPLRLAAREHNPPFVDTVLAACRRAGFEPLRAAAFDTLQNVLIETGFGEQCWTVLYRETARNTPARRVSYRPIRDPAIEVTTALVVQAGTTPVQQALLDVARGSGCAWPRDDTDMR